HFTLDSRMAGLTGMSLSRDGKTVALGTADSTIRLWNVPTGQELFTEFQGHDAAVNWLAFVPEGNTLVTADDNGQLFQWDTASWKQNRKVRVNHHGFALSPDGKRFVTEEFSRTMHVWDCETGAEITNMKRPEEGWIRGLAFSQDSKALVSLSWNIAKDGSAGLIVGDAVHGKQTRQISLPGIDLEEFLTLASPQALALTRGGQTAFLGDGQGGIHLFDLGEGKQIGHFAGHKNLAGALALSTDDKTLLSGSRH